MKARQARVAAGIALGLALAAGISGPLLQRRYLRTSDDARLSVERLSRARVDLSEGVLHLTLGAVGDSPWDRATGLALIDQALEDLATAEQPDPKLLEAIASFRAALEAFRAEGPSTATQTRLRFAATPLLVEAQRHDAVRREAWRALQRRQNTSLEVALWVVAVVFGLASFGIWSVASLQARSSAAIELSEFRLRQLARAFPGVFWLEERGELLYITGRHGTLWGLTGDELPHGSPLSWTTYVHADDLERLASAGRGPGLSLEYRVVLGGAVRWLRVVTAPVDDAPHLLAGFARDITHERALAAKLRHAEKLELMGQLARGVAHDLNNLLSVVHAASTSLREPLPPEERAEVLDDLADVAERGTRLTRQLLAFNRQREVRVERVDLNRITHDTCELFRRLLRGGVTLTLELCEGPLVVEGEQALLEQALLNLLVNARDAIVGAGTLTVRSAREGQRARLSVTDTGTGIPSDVLEHIFEPLFTTKAEGTGIGLATVKSVVEQHHGEVRVDTAPGVGSTFTLEVPLVDAR